MMSELFATLWPYQVARVIEGFIVRAATIRLTRIGFQLGTGFSLILRTSILMILRKRFSICLVFQKRPFRAVAISQNVATFGKNQA